MFLHLEESFQRDIDRIRKNIQEMSDRVEIALRDYLRAFAEGNRQLAYAVILRDQYIDEKEKEIDRLCLEFIVRQQPVAQHLRMAYSTIKINLEIERVGDYAENASRHLLRLKEPPPPAITESIVQMANLSISMFHDAIRAFLEQDPKLAQQNMEIEETVDGLRTQLNTTMAGLLGEQKITYETFDPVMCLIRRFERVSDQARNICMEVLYMCTGEFAKHPGAEVFRVLFVDGHNSCRSQMAEAIALSQKQSKFIFNSAGIDPRPITRVTMDFMKSKGFDLTRTAPRAIHQIPNIDHYQVIVALSKGALRAFPQSPRKVVFLEWLVPDPSEKQGSPEEIRVVYEETFQFLQSHIRDLVQAIIGNES